MVKQLDVLPALVTQPIGFPCFPIRSVSSGPALRHCHCHSVKENDPTVSIAGAFSSHVTEVFSGLAHWEIAGAGRGCMYGGFSAKVCAYVVVKCVAR